MAKKTENKISVSAMERIAKECNNVVELEWHGENLEIRECISLAEVRAFVELCVKHCFDERFEQFYPDRLEPSITMCTVAFYSNVTVTANPEKFYNMIRSTHLIDTIMGHIDISQYAAITEAISQYIKDIVDIRRSNIRREAERIANQLEDTGNNIKETFGSISPEDMKALIGAISAGKLDEEKLVKAYIENK